MKRRVEFLPLFQIIIKYDYCLICVFTNFLDFSLESEKILKRIGRLIGISQKCGRVERSHKEDAAFFDEIAVLLCNLEIL